MKSLLILAVLSLSGCASPPIMLFDRKGDNGSNAFSRDWAECTRLHSPSRGMVQSCMQGENWERVYFSHERKSPSYLDKDFKVCDYQLMVTGKPYGFSDLRSCLAGMGWKQESCITDPRKSRPGYCL